MMIAFSAHTFRLSELAVLRAHLRRAGWGWRRSSLHSGKAAVKSIFYRQAQSRKFTPARLTEYSGGDLALWELAHGLEWLALPGLVVSLAFPRTGSRLPMHGSSLSLIRTRGSAGDGSRCHRSFTIDRSVRFYWRWSVALAVVFLVSAVIFRG